MNLKLLAPIIAGTLVLSSSAFALQASDSMNAAETAYKKPTLENLLTNPAFENKGLGWSYWFANFKDDNAYVGRYQEGSRLGPVIVLARWWLFQKRVITIYLLISLAQATMRFYL